MFEPHGTLISGFTYTKLLKKCKNADGSVSENNIFIKLRDLKIDTLRKVGTDLERWAPTMMDIHPEHLKILNMGPMSTWKHEMKI